MFFQAHNIFLSVHLYSHIQCNPEFNPYFFKSIFCVKVMSLTCSLFTGAFKLFIFLYIEYPRFIIFNIVIMLCNIQYCLCTNSFCTFNISIKMQFQTTMYEVTRIVYILLNIYHNVQITEPLLVKCIIRSLCHSTLNFCCLFQNLPFMHK